MPVKEYEVDGHTYLYEEKDAPKDAKLVTDKTRASLSQAVEDRINAGASGKADAKPANKAAKQPENKEAKKADNKSTEATETQTANVPEEPVVGTDTGITDDTTGFAAASE